MSAVTSEIHKVSKILIYFYYRKLLKLYLQPYVEIVHTRRNTLRFSFYFQMQLFKIFTLIFGIQDMFANGNVMVLNLY